MATDMTSTQRAVATRGPRTARRRLLPALVATIVASVGMVGVPAQAADRAGAGVVVSADSAVGDTPARARIAASSGPERVRIGGATRYETAAAIVSWRARGPIPAGPTLRFVSGTRPIDAIAHGKDAVPTLYLPPAGAVPEDVGAAYRLVGPSRVEVIGSERELPSSQVRAVVGAKPFVRLTDTDAPRVMWRAATAASEWIMDDSWRAMSPVAFASARVLAEAAITVQARGWFPVIVPDTDPMPAGAQLYPAAFLGNLPSVIGGQSTLSAARRATLLRRESGMKDAPFTDVAGSNRYATAADVAYLAFPSGAPTAYLVSGIGGADAAATVSLVDGPVLLVPPCGPVPPEPAALLRKLQPHRIVTIGERRAVCDDVLDHTSVLSTGPQDESARQIAMTGDAACLLDTEGVVDCWSRKAADPQKRALRGPMTWANAESGLTALSPGLFEQMCGIAADASLRCWDPLASPGKQTASRTILEASAGIVDYQSSGDVACALGRDGRVWCHDTQAQTPTVRAALGPAKGIAIAETSSCVLRRDDTVWCWVQELGASTGEPTRLAVGDDVAQIAMSSHGLLVRHDDGRVALVAPADLSAGRAVAREVVSRSTRLLPQADGCLVDGDGRLDCPLDSTAVRRAYRELAPDKVLAVARVWGMGCVVRQDGSAACRSEARAGTWGALGDGLWAPRYRPAEVLGYARPADRVTVE